MSFSATILASPVWRLFVALTIGLLIGIDRERRKGKGTGRAPAGLRTIAIVSLLGGVSAQTGSTALIVLSGVFVSAATLVSYWFGSRSDPGLTTEVALFIAFALGVLAQSQPVLALGAGVTVTALLAVRTPLHHFVRDILTEQELRDGLTFFIAALVVLPLLPNHTIDPYRLINPFAVWRLAVVLMALSAAGYIATRALGPRYGLFVAGFASGFVSSTATIAAMGGRARSDPQLTVPAASGAVASVLGSLIYLICLMTAADPDLLRQLAKPLGGAVAGILGYALLLELRAASADVPPNRPGRAFDLKTVLLFAGLVGVFALVSTLLFTWFGEPGALGGAMATGLVDIHAAGVSIATLMSTGKIKPDIGMLAILVALATNMLSKIPASFALGPRGFAVRVSLGLVALLIGLAAGYFWQTLGSGAA